MLPQVIMETVEYSLVDVIVLNFFGPTIIRQEIIPQSQHVGPAVAEI
jgi:hypothetical protein